MEESIEKVKQHINFTRNSNIHAYTNILLQELLDIIEQLKAENNNKK